MTLSVGVLHDAARMEWLIEKACELGVTQVNLLRSSRVQRSKYKLGRLEAKAVAALKQSARAWLPAIAELDFGDVLSLKPDAADGVTKLIAHCDDSLERVHVRIAKPTPEGVHLMIGPEGDFTREEISAAQSAGFVGVTLGPARLRTETAAIAVLAALLLR